MAKQNESEVIAVANFLYGDVDTLLEIYKPVPAFEDSDEFSCSFAIRGGVSFSSNIIGFDSMQSLVLCMQFIKRLFNDGAIIDKKKIKWNGGDIGYLTL